MITGKSALKGNNVSHAQNKTKRKFYPNVMDANLYSESLGRTIRLKVSNAGLRTLDHIGGLDTFISKTPVSKLDPALKPYKARIEEVIAKKSSAA